MKKQKKRLLLWICALAALLLAAAWLRLPVKREGEEPGRQEEYDNGNSGRLVGYEEEAIRHIRVKWAGEALEISHGNEGFVPQEIPPEKQDTKKTAAVVGRLCESRITERLGVQEDLGQFGLNRDAAQFTITGEGGEVQEFWVGNRLGQNAEEVYVLTDKEVCVVTGFPAAFTEGRKAFYRLDLIINSNEKGGQTEEKLEYLELTGEQFPDPVRIVQSRETGSGYLMEEPAYAEAMFAQTQGQAEASPLVSSLTEVTAEAVAVVNADGGAVREYGLDRPQARVHYCIGGKEHRLTVGKQRKDNTRYLMVDEDKNIYVVSEEQVGAWAEADAMDLRTSYLWLVDVNRLERLVISIGTDTFEYQIGRKEEKDGEQRIEVSSRGRTIDAVKTWLPFYQKLLGMTVMSAKKPEKWEETPSLTVAYDTEENREDPLTVSFCKSAEEGCYAAFLNGSFAGALRIPTVEEIMELINRVNADEKSN